MKFFIPSTIALAALGLGVSLQAQDAKPGTEQQKVSYAIGVDVVRTLKQQGIEIDPQFLAAAVRDAGTGATLQMTTEEMTATLTALQQTQRAKQQAQMAKMQEAKKAAGTANEAEGKKFLDENKGKPGVTVLPDGLQYKVLTAGTGATPKATDTVTVNYRGTLINGTEFDSSYKRGEPATFPVSGVIKGWTEVLQLMKTGSKYQVFIPSNLAYGERGAGADIGPNATLIFDIELISVADAAAPATTPPAASPAK